MGAKILVEQGEQGIILKIETDTPISETEEENLDACQKFVLHLISAGSQTGIWPALNVENILGDMTPKPPPGAEIIDLHLDRSYEMSSGPMIFPEDPFDGGPRTAQV